MATGARREDGSAAARPCDGSGTSCWRETPPMTRQPRPVWLSRIETLGTTLIVLLVGGMMIWYEALERETRLAVTIGSAVLLYLLALVFFGRRSNPAHIAWWPFALAGVGAAAVAELINAQFMVTRELLI